MNRITKFVNRVDQALAPLGELVKDENFKGEMLFSAGVKEKSDEASKAKTKEKLNFLLAALDALRKKLGLDKSDVPNVNNIAGLAVILQEVYLVIKSIIELLTTCEIIGPEGQEYTNDEKDQAMNNALRAILKCLTQNAIKKESPKLATMLEALTIFSDEKNEVFRALDLVLFSPLTIAKYLDDEINPDIFRPLGDFQADDRLRHSKCAFLWVSIGFIFLSKSVAPLGRFLFNLGHEPVTKDVFPNASLIAERIMQIQFIPGRFLSADGEEYDDEFRVPNTTDAFFSFATIPVFPAGAEPGTEPEGYQYVLGMNLNPGQFGSDVDDISITFPTDIAVSFIWGHNTQFHSFSPFVLGPDPLIQIHWKGKKEGEEGEAGDSNGVGKGDVLLKIHPKKKTVNNKEELDAEFSLEFHDFSFSLSGEGRDGFLQKILPENGAAKIKISASFVYSPLLNKWSIEGLDKNDGLLLLFNVGKTLFNTIEIPTLYVGLKPSTDADKAIQGVELEASALIKLILGPFQMTVDRLGLSLALNFPKNSDGNLGFADLDLGLKPPTAIGFLVEASVVKGGGILSFDPDNHQYYGAGELSVKLGKFKLTLKIIAIILTQLPDGTKGFSFLLMATIEFNPAIDTPFGFKLKGVGVLVGLHRSMNLEAFQNAVKDDRFDSILFPDNPVGNAPTIVKTMNSLFPPVQGRYVFALMARIGWGTGKLVDLKLGLLIEVPSPVKIAIAGVIKVSVKKGEAEIVKLQINFLVALDFGKQIFSIDASISGSRFLRFDIRGQMFVRYRWGNDPVFLISVGGWHPDFEVPGGLNLPAKFDRITVPLLESSNLSLILSCYVALTSNTVQAGFKIDFKMKWSKFRLEAGLGVDALFHFDPFYFVVDFEGKLHIYWGDSTLAGVSVKGKFSGTHPWRIQGTATFEIWIWDYDVDFDKSTGEELSENSQEVDVLPMIEKAILDRNNWQSTLPDGRSTHIVLRNTDKDLATTNDEEAVAGPILADPLSRIDVMQQIAPLAIRIDKIGYQKVKGARKFELAAKASNGDALEGNDLEDHFAPAMFLDMEDAEKISRKSFEPLKAGRSFADMETITSGIGKLSPFEFDDQFNDPLYPSPSEDHSNPPGSKMPSVTEDHFKLLLGRNSVARSSEGRKAVSQKEIASRKKTGRADPFIVTDAITGARLTEAAGQKSMTGAYYELWKIQKTNPLRKMNVIRESELIS